MKKLSIIIGGQDFAGNKYGEYLKNFAETVLNNVNGKIVEVSGFKDVYQMRGFEKNIIEQLHTKEATNYSRKSDEKDLKYIIQKQ